MKPNYLVLSTTLRQDWALTRWLNDHIWSAGYEVLKIEVIEGTTRVYAQSRTGTRSKAKGF